MTWGGGNWQSWQNKFEHKNAILIPSCNYKQILKQLCSLPFYLHSLSSYCISGQRGVQDSSVGSGVWLLLVFVLYVAVGRAIPPGVLWPAGSLLLFVTSSASFIFCSGRQLWSLQSSVYARSDDILVVGQEENADQQHW